VLRLDPEIRWCCAITQPGAAHDPALVIRVQLLRTSLAFAPGATTEAMFAAGVELR